jgi:hypothetical protein
MAQHTPGKDSTTLRRSPTRALLPNPMLRFPINRRSPRMPAPSIKSRMVPNTWVVAIVHMSAPTVAAIKSNMIASTGVESPRVVGAPAAGHVGSLHVAAVSGRDDAGSVALTHHCAAAADSVVNLHAIAIDGTNRSIGTNARRSSALQRNCPARRSTAAYVATAGCRRTTACRARTRACRAGTPARCGTRSAARCRVARCCPRTATRRRVARCRCARTATRRRVARCRSRATACRRVTRRARAATRRGSMGRCRTMRWRRSMRCGRRMRCALDFAGADFAGAPPPLGLCWPQAIAGTTNESRSTSPFCKISSLVEVRFITAS